MSVAYLPQPNRIVQSAIIEELRLDFRCRHKAETLIALCQKAVDVWKTTAIGLYNPQHTQQIFGDAEITRKLSRLEITVVSLFAEKIGYRLILCPCGSPLFREGAGREQGMLRQNLKKKTKAPLFAIAWRTR